MRSRRGGRHTSAASLLLAVVLALGAYCIVEARCRRYVVSGRSMEPTLQEGDWVLVDSAAYRGCRPRIGDLVAARDPRESARIVFKRVARRNPRGVWLLGDNPGESTDSRTFGWVADGAVVGKMWLRYWPLGEFAILY